MPHPISIIVTVDSTPTLRSSYVGTRNRRPYAAFASKMPYGSQTQPLVVVRGCSPIRLQATTSADPQIQWSVKTCGQPSINLPGVQGPSLSSSQGKITTLTTDAVGDYCVTAWYIDPSSQDRVEATWYFRFVGAKVTFTEFDPEELGSKLSSPKQALFLAEFTFTASINFFGGGTDGTGGVDSVRVKVIQNLTGVLSGIYRLEQSETQAKSGRLTEGCPLAQPPYIDCADEDEIPFYNSASVTDKTAPARGIDFTDTPGLTIAPYFDPQRKKAVTLKSGKVSTFYTLVGTEGENQFFAAVVAYSKHLKNTYVVLAKMHWKLDVTSAAQIELDDNPFGFKCTCKPQVGSGTSKVKEEILQSPLEASAAGIETYGPTAVSGGEDSDDDNATDYTKYHWQQT